MYKLHIFYVLDLVSEPPEFAFWPFFPSVWVNEQDGVILVCETSLFLYKNCTLQKDGQVLEAKIASSSNLRVLEYKISSVNISDAGIYECIGTLTQGGAKTLVRSIGVQSKDLF